MKKKLIQALLCPLLVTGLLLAPLPGLSHSAVNAASTTTTATTAKAKQIEVFVDGKKLSLSAPAYKANGVTFVPMKDIFTALGGTVTLEASTQTIIGRKDSISISLKIGKKEAIVNGNSVKLDAAAVITKGVTFVPVRFISQSLEADVEWDDTAKAVRITSLEKMEDLEYEQWLEERNNKLKLTPQEIVSTFDESVVTIYTNRGQGSGVVIGDQLILTNYHVMMDASTATASSIYEDDLKIAGVVSYDKQSDLAIIKTEKPLDLAAVDISYNFFSQKGDRVIAIGSPEGLENTASEGLISNIIHEEGITYFQTSAPIDHGSSGGALFNEYGELIGITTSGIDKTNANLNFAVSIMHAVLLKEKMTDVMIKNAKFLPYSLPDTLVGASMADIQKLMTSEYSSVQTSDAVAEFTKWEAKRDSAGWLVLTANINPDFYLYYGAESAEELRIWFLNLGYELNRMLPNEKVQLLISFEEDYNFEIRGTNPGELTSLGNDKWRLKFTVIDMQLRDKIYMKMRFQA